MIRLADVRDARKDAHGILNAVGRSGPLADLPAGLEDLQGIAEHLTALEDKIPCAADRNMGAGWKGKANNDIARRAPNCPRIAPQEIDSAFSPRGSDRVLDIVAIAVVAVRGPRLDHVARLVAQADDGSEAHTAPPR